MPFIATFWFRPFTPAEALLAYGVPIAIMLAIGAHKLVRFLRDYPVRDTRSAGVS